MVIEQLSSQRDDRDHAAKRALAAQCANTPAIIEQVVVGLTYPDAAIIADCADVLADLAASHPDLVAPHGDAVVPLLDHPTNKVRWQAMQIVALISSRRPDLMGPLLPRLMATIEADTSIIARDKATDAIANYAGTSPHAALEATPFLIEILQIANGRFASRALHGLRLAIIAAPDIADRLLPDATEHLDHHRGVARTAAKQLLRQIEATGLREPEARIARPAWSPPAHLSSDKPKARCSARVSLHPGVAPPGHEVRIGGLRPSR